MTDTNELQKALNYSLDVLLDVDDIMNDIEDYITADTKTYHNKLLSELIRETEELKSTFHSKILESPHSVDNLNDLYSIRNEVIAGVKAILMRNKL